MTRDEKRREALRLQKTGMKRKDICRALHMSPSTLCKILGSIRKRLHAEGSTFDGWVVNHPYQNNLREEERKRYLEVIHQRQERNPKMGWDYQAKKQVSYRNGVLQ